MSGGRPRAAHQSSAAPGGTQQNPSAFEVKTDLFKAYILESADPNVTIVTLEGRIEQDQKKHFEDFFDRFVMQEGQTFLCDMKGLLSINSAGWGVMVAQFQRLKKHGGRFCLCGMRAEVDQCFQVLELHKLFPAFRSVSDALRSIDHEKENDASIMKTKTPWAGESQEKKSTLLLDDKIRRIIADHPGASAGKISKMLKSEEYGKVKIGLWTLQAKLRSMNLGTKDERFRYFRSS
jgi:anti-anti-sigma factor